MSPILMISGGSRGIGAATARLAAKRGYDVSFSFLSDQRSADQVVRDIEAVGQRGLAVRADMASESDIQRFFHVTEDRLGKVRALVNNAGILETQMRVDEMDSERLHRILAVNVVGYFLCAKEAVRRMSSRYGGEGGAIVNVSSAASRLGSAGEYVDYAASKGAVDTLTIGLAGEVAAEGIRVNAVRPGFIDTDIHAAGGEPNRLERIAPNIPLGRGGQAEEVAQAILWLLSEEASYCTGTFLDVAGGR